MNTSVLSEQLILMAELLERPPSKALSLTPPGREAAPLVLEPSDDLAAAHYQVFCHELMPAGSVFLDPRAMMGGTASDDAWTHMKEHGFEPDTSSILADHLSNELRFLGYLLDRQMVETAQVVVYSALMGWLPVFLDRLSGVDQPELAGLAPLLEDLLIEIGSPPDHSGVQLRGVPPTSFSLEDDSTGLAAIGEFFSTHAESGLFIPRSRLMAEARRHRLPTGFGSKARTIEGMFRSAGQYDELPAVLDFLDGEIRSHLEIWAAWSEKGSAAWSKAWTDKLSGTSAVVQKLRQAGD